MGLLLPPLVGEGGGEIIDPFLSNVHAAAVDFSSLNV
jgi:hypothetical protein